ncbi:hypothetical protein BDV95DRAFT_597721 [Massariosphaeria phaeospora]|uniref:Uncharacterized protein n=1 Tax=Massariosphaeria phaeospora TaxID=100035 RepID=A0A7C8M473_9PLEO|nr:hypothetical protein BDV95DRAFT_597721 [Massariosphaeria phaeospora]
MAPDNNADADTPPSPDPKRVTCKTCARTLGTISLADGLLVRAATDAHEPCDACRGFEALYAEVQRADAEWEAVKGRRQDHGGRQQALVATKAAHMALDNFLMRVEAPVVMRMARMGERGKEREVRGKEQEQEQELQQRPIHAADRQQLHQHGASTLKRSSTPPRSPTAANATTITYKRPRLTFTHLPHRPSSSSSTPTPSPSSPSTSTSSSRRVSFPASTLEAEHRTTAAFARSSELYVPGRNAAPQGSAWLDTNGLDQAYSKFHRVRKVKGKWVSTGEGDDVEMGEERGEVGKEVNGEGVVERGEERGDGDEDPAVSDEARVMVGDGKEQMERDVASLETKVKEPDGEEKTKVDGSSADTSV